MPENIEYCLKLYYPYTEKYRDIIRDIISKSLSLYDTGLSDDVSLSNSTVAEVLNQLHINNVKCKSEGKIFRFQYGNVKDNLNWVSIHINVPEEYCPYLVGTLADYLSNTLNVEYEGFFSKERKSDQVVISVGDMNAASAVLGYIDDNEKLLECLKSSSPFLSHHGDLGLSFHHTLDVNKFMAYLISDYLCSLDDENDISFNNFIAHVWNFHNGLKNSPKILESFKESDLFINDFNSIKNIKPSISEAELLSYYVISTELFLGCHDGTTFLQYLFNASKDKNRC